MFLPYMFLPYMFRIRICSLNKFIDTVTYVKKYVVLNITVV